VALTELEPLRVWKLADRETIVFNRGPQLDDPVWWATEGDGVIVGWVSWVEWEQDAANPFGIKAEVGVLQPGVPSCTTTFRFLVEAEPAPFAFPDVSQA
jgi:hypothetical protein